MSGYGNLQKIRNGKRTFAITPHIPGGFILPDDLIKIGEVTKKYKGVLKITSGQRILITNLKEEDLPTIGIGMKLSKNFHGMELPCRTKIGVAGCRNACTSVYSKDIGVLVDLDKKFFITAGGSAGYYPRSADIVTKGLSEKEAFHLVETILNYYNEKAEPGEKLGDFIDRISIETFREEVLSLANLEIKL